MALFNFLRFIVFSLAFNLILFHKYLKFIIGLNFVVAFMLVHTFNWVWFEFKFIFEFKLCLN